MPRGRKKQHQTTEAKKKANLEAARRYRARSRTSTASFKSAGSSNRSFDISTIPAFEDTAGNEIADSEAGSGTSDWEDELGPEARRVEDDNLDEISVGADSGEQHIEVRTRNSVPPSSATTRRLSGWNSLFYRAQVAQNNIPGAEIPSAERQIDLGPGPVSTSDKSVEVEPVDDTSFDTHVPHQLAGGDDAQLNIPENTIDDTLPYGKRGDDVSVYNFEDFPPEDDRGGDLVLPHGPVMDDLYAVAGALAHGDNDDDIEIIDETRGPDIVGQYEDVTDDESDAESDTESAEGVDDEEAFEIAKRTIVASFSSQLLNFHGCGDHDVEHNGGHDKRKLGSHAGLNEIVDACENLPKVLGLGKKLLQHTGLQVPAEEFARSFTGTDVPRKGHSATGSELAKPRVCLSCDSGRTWEQFGSGDSPDGPGSSALVDVDSAFAFPTSLGMANFGIDFAINSVWGTTLNTNLHFYRDLTWTQDRQRMKGSVPLHQIPHMRLGRIRTLPDSDLFVFFPHAYIGRDNFRHLLDSHLEMWSNCLLEIIREVLPRSQTQHLPPSYRVAELHSLARHDETRILNNDGEPKKAYRHFYLPEESSNLIWENVVTRLGSVRGLRHLREPFLFINCKNWKTKTKRPTLEGAYSAFRKSWDMSINSAYIPDHEGLFIDWGRETVREQGEQQTYLWRTCCLKSYAKWIRDISGMKPRQPPELYYHAMLTEAAGLRMAIPRKSKLRRAGLVFTQIYHSSKEMFDANKTFPFTHKRLGSLALDPRVQQSIRNKKSSDGSTASTTKAYLNSRNRVNAVIEGSRILSFGGREEHRMSVEFVELLFAELGELATRETIVPDLWPLYTIPTELYADFLSANVNKFCAAFEYVLADFRGQSIPPEVTKVLALFLRCVQVSYGDSLLSQQWALWADKAKDGTQGPRADWQGIGFSKSFESGYCWFMEKVDWRRMVFFKEFADGMSFGLSTKFLGFARTGEEIEAIRTEFDENNKLQQLYRLYGGHYKCQDLITRAMAKLILRLFKSAIATAVEEECKDGGFELLAGGNYTLCYKTMEAAFGQRPIVVLAGPGRTFGSLESVVEYYFGDNDNVRRAVGWSRKSFRAIYEANKDFLSNYGTRPVASLVNKLERAIRLTCWLLPLGRPSEGKFITRCRYGAVKFGPEQSEGQMRSRWIATSHPFLLDHHARNNVHASPSKHGTMSWKTLLELEQTVKSEQRKRGRQGQAPSDCGWILAKKDSEILRLTTPGTIPDGFLGGTTADLGATCRQIAAQNEKSVVRGELGGRARSSSRPRGETPSQFADPSDEEQARFIPKRDPTTRKKHFFVLMSNYGALICTECGTAVSPGAPGAREHLKKHPETSNKIRQEVINWCSKQNVRRPRDLHVPARPIREAVPNIAKPQSGYRCPYCPKYSTSKRAITEHQRFDHYRKKERIIEVMMQSWTQASRESWWEIDEGATETMASSFAAAAKEDADRRSPSKELG